MKLYPVISQPLYQENIQYKHDARRPVVNKSMATSGVSSTIRNNAGAFNKEVSVGSLNEISKIYERLLWMQFVIILSSLLMDLMYIREQAFVPKNKEKRGPQKNKRVLEYYRQNARNRKNVINDGGLCEFEQETKQQNLDRLVSELESEQIVKPVAQPDMAWIDSLNKEKTAAERENELRASDFFAQQAKKQNADELYLERKSLATQPVQNTDVDYDELYDQTKSTRAVVNAFNTVQHTK